jgi:hypothetical protein
MFLSFRALIATLFFSQKNFRLPGRICIVVVAVFVISSRLLRQHPATIFYRPGPALPYLMHPFMSPAMHHSQLSVSNLRLAVDATAHQAAFLWQQLIFEYDNRNNMVWHMEVQAPQPTADLRLFDAAACGCVLQLKHVLDCNAALLHARTSARDEHGNYALRIASMYGHAAAVLLLETIMQPLLKNIAGQTSYEVWCCKLAQPQPPKRHPEYPNATTQQRRNAARDKSVNSLSDQLDGLLRTPSDFDGWRKHLSEWKALGALDLHASPVLFRMLKSIRDRVTDLPQFSHGDYLHSPSMLFELLAALA